MPTPILNHVPGMIKNQGQIIESFGKDCTGQINYQFNQQGFRGILDFDFMPEYAFFGCSLVFGKKHFHICLIAHKIMVWQDLTIIAML